MQMGQHPSHVVMGGDLITDKKRLLGGEQLDVFMKLRPTAIKLLLQCQ